MLESGRVLDRYTVLDELGRGGMAVVYRVRHNTLGSEHALKLLTIHGASIRERLVMEGRVQAGLRHPNIVAVTDVIDVEGSPGLVMEYIEGPSLEAWLLNNKPGLAEAEALFRGVLAGVRRAHRVGLVHRDLKPGNVLLETTEEGTIPKVADFGLAKALESGGGMNRTRTGIAMGTPAYMAPEQIRDAKNVDERADIFSLGCILYELVVGVAPFEGPDVLSIFNSVCEGRYVSVQERVPVSPQLDEAIQGCLQVDREQRIPSCDVLLEVLDGGSWSAVASAVTSPPPPTLHPGAGASAAGVGLSGQGSPMSTGRPSQPTVAHHVAPAAPSQVSLLPDIEPASSLVPRTVPPIAEAYEPPPPATPPRGLKAVALGGVALALCLAGVYAMTGEEPSPAPAMPQVTPAPKAPTDYVPAPAKPAAEPAAAPAKAAPSKTTRNASGGKTSGSKASGSKATGHAGPTVRDDGPVAAPVRAEPVAPPAATPEPEPKPAETVEAGARPRLVDQLRLATKSSYKVRGDALAVWLVGPDGKKHSAGAQIPSGKYAIKARFKSWDGVVDAGTLQILPGSVVTITCKEALLSCTR